MAVILAIQCRCGTTFSVVPLLQAFRAALSFRPSSTTAVNPAIQCRCGVALRSAPYHRLSKQHCASESFSSFHIFHFPSYILPSITTSPFFPPSEGAQDPLVFVPLSEGAWRRHSFENVLCPCFSCRRAFPTFRRCAGSPRFRPTFRRCAEASQLRERPVSVFLLSPCISHLRKVRRIPLFSSHFPKVRGGVTASRTPCIRVSPVAVHFPPSEGVQDPRVFISPSEGDRAFSQVFLVPVD